LFHSLLFNDASFYINLWTPSSAEKSELSENYPRPGLIVLKALKALACKNGNKILSKLISSNKDNKYNIRYRSVFRSHDEVGEV